MEFLPPDWMDGRTMEAKTFNRLCNHLKNEQPNVPLNIDYVAMLATELTRYQKASNQLSQEDFVLTIPNGNKQLNPLTKIIDDSFKKVEKGFDYLGLTVSAENVSDGETKDELLKEFMKKFGGEQ